MYADKITDSMQVAIDETKRRREIQSAYNKKHGIVPKTIEKEIRDVIRATMVVEDEEQTYEPKAKQFHKMSKRDKEKVLQNMEKEMLEAAKALDFEKAAELRDL